MNRNPDLEQQPIDAADAEEDCDMDAESDFHGRMMNIPHQPFTTNYGLGHRDARHAAAEIANEADGEIRRLTAALAAAEERVRQIIEANIQQAKNAREAYAAVEERARVLTEAAERVAQIFEISAEDHDNVPSNPVEAESSAYKDCANFVRTRILDITPPEGDAP